MLSVGFLRLRAIAVPQLIRMLVLGLCLFAPGVAALRAAPTNKPAEDPSPITDYFSLRASFFAPTVDTDARFDSRTGRVGTPLSAERDLGMDGKIDQGRAELIFRMRPRHRLRVDYFKLDRDGNTILAKTINFGNSTYNANDHVISTIGWRMLGLSYSYSVVRTKRFELGLGLGLHIVQAEASALVRSRNIRDDGTAVGALPTAVLDGTWQFSRRWSVNAHVQRLSLSVSDVSGSYGDYHLDAQYRWRPNMAFGVGYTALKTDVTTKGSNLPGIFAMNTRGPEAFFRVSF